MAEAKSPRYMCAHAQRLGAAVGAEPPEENGGGEEKAGHLPPAALIERRQGETIFGCRRFEPQPEQLPHELDRVPVYRGQHVEANDLDGDETAEQRGNSEEAQIDGANLGIAQPAEEVDVCGYTGARPVAVPHGHAHVGWAVNLNAREDILIFDHFHSSPDQDQIGRSSHQFHHSGQPEVQNGPLMTMQTALQNTAASARNRPSLWMPSVPTE